MKRSTKIRIVRQGASDAFLPCRAAVVPPDPHIHRRDHPPSPPADRLTLAQAQPRSAGPAGPGLPAQRRHVRRARGRVGISTATAWRYVTETVALLAARSPKLRQVLRDAKDAGHAYLVIDGTLIPIDRVAADRPFYSGKHRKHGMNLQVIAGPDGDIVWVSGPLPGAVHDLTAARIWGIVRELAASGLVVPGDKGYLSEDDIRTPTGDGTSPRPRRTPTARTPGCGRLRRTRRARAPAHRHAGRRSPRRRPRPLPRAP